MTHPLTCRFMCSSGVFRAARTRRAEVRSSDGGLVPEISPRSRKVFSNGDLHGNETMDADTWLDVVFTEEEWGDFCSRLTRGTDRKLRGKIQRINILSRVPEKRRIQVEADEIKIDGLAVILPTNLRMGLECFASTECVSEAAVSSYVWKNEVATHDTIRSNFARLQKSLKKKYHLLVAFRYEHGYWSIQLPSEKNLAND